MLDQRAEVHLVVYKTHLLQMNEERSIYNSKYIVTLSTPHEFNGTFLDIGIYGMFMLLEHEFLRQRSNHSTGVDSVIINIGHNSSFLSLINDLHLSSFRQNVVPDPEIVRY